jgi:ATP-dependent Clp protease protease subunit
LTNHHPTQEPQPQNLSVVDQLFKSRIIWIGTDVNDVMANDIASKILLLSLQDPKADILLFINSPGGSISSGGVIIDMADLVPNEIVTAGFGMAASMGEFLLACAGTPGKRFATPSLRVLLHQPSGGAGGDSASVITQAKLINDMKHVLAARTAKATGQTIEKIIADGDRDSWYNAEEALEYGFVDHILTDIHDLVNIPTAINRKLAEAEAAKATPAKKVPAKKAPATKSTATKGSN